MKENQGTANNSTKAYPPSGSGAASSHKYHGDLTSKEAGNMVRDMIREQEKAMMTAYQDIDKK